MTLRKSSISIRICGYDIYCEFWYFHWELQFYSKIKFILLTLQSISILALFVQRWSVVFLFLSYDSTWCSTQTPLHDGVRITFTHVSWKERDKWAIKITLIQWFASNTSIWKNVKYSRGEFFSKFNWTFFLFQWVLAF